MNAKPPDLIGEGNLLRFATSIRSRGEGEGARDEGRGARDASCCSPMEVFSQMLFPIFLSLFSIFCLSVSQFATPQQVIKIETHLVPGGRHRMASIPFILLGKSGHSAGCSDRFWNERRVSS